MSEFINAVEFSKRDRQQLFFVAGSYTGNLDIIFVHGLDGHPFHTWTHKKEAKTFHLTKSCSNWFTWLARDLPDARIFTLGYPASSSVLSGFSMELADRAEAVCGLLQDARIGERPLLFVAHSLGGLVVKKVLQLAAFSKRPERSAMFDNTLGLIFFAVPNHGSSSASLVNLLFRPFVSKALKGLLYNDANLRDLQKWMDKNLLEHTKLLPFVEKRPLIRWLPFIVSESVGCPYAGKGVSERGRGIDADHISICKLLNDKQDPYKSVVSFIQEECMALPPVPENLYNAPEQYGITRLYWDAAGIIPELECFFRGNKSRCAIIEAPSGYGKTSLVRSLMKRDIIPDAHWCDAMISPIGQFSASEVLIIDNLGPWEQLALERRQAVVTATTSAKRVIICTTSEHTKNILKALFGDSSEVRSFQIPALTEEQSKECLKLYCLKKSILVNFSDEDIEVLCRKSSGIPAILFLAADLMSSNADTLREVLRQSREGGHEALAKTIIDKWLLTIAGDKNDILRDILALLASDACVFGLSALHIAMILNISTDEVESALKPLFSRGIIYEAIPEFDSTLIVHDMYRRALYTGDSENSEVLEQWAQHIGDIKEFSEGTCLSSLTVRLWAARNAFIEMSSKDELYQRDISDFHHRTDELGKWLREQFVNIDLLRAGLERTVKRAVVKDCTIAVGICRAVGQLQPPNAAIGEVVWLLTQHDDEMARADAVCAASRHWLAYNSLQREPCLGALERFAYAEVESNSGAPTAFCVGAALAGMINLGFAERVLHLWTQLEIQMRDLQLEWCITRAIVALALSVKRLDLAELIWKEMERNPGSSDCDAAARLYLRRGARLRTVREKLLPMGSLILPIKGRESRVLGSAFYSLNDNFWSFVVEAKRRDWVALSN